MRHVAACNNAEIPGGRTPLSLGGTPVGWVSPAVLDVIGGTDFLDLRWPAAALAGAGLCRFRDEAFDVRATPEGPGLGVVDRGALPALGLLALGVHLNGLVQRDDGPWLWVARRAASKALDPGKLDHLAAGGVSSGMTPWQTLMKEAEEEAALPTALCRCADPAGTIDYAMARAEGLRRDRLYVYDLWLPESFVPRPADGEAESFELWPLAAALDRVRRTDDFKFNVNLVLIELFKRHGLI